MEERAHINSIMTPQERPVKGCWPLTPHPSSGYCDSQELPIRTDVFPGFGAECRLLSPLALSGLRLQEGGMAFPHHECHDPLARAVLPQPQPNKVILYPAPGRAGDRAVQCCLGAGDGKARGESHWPFLSSLYRWLPRCREGALMGVGMGRGKGAKALTSGHLSSG